MLDIAIIGAGLCGLSLARQLQAHQLDYAVFEARNRPGGRIYSKAPYSRPTTQFDLGATWFWSQSEPLVSDLIAELGLSRFPQHDSGTVLRLRDPDKAAAPVAVDGVHAGAQRLHGGTASLIDALTAGIPIVQMHYKHVLIMVNDCGDHVELHFLRDDELLLIKARRVVLTIPPRLLVEQVRFEPKLDDNLLNRMRATPTWMASQAKAVLLYDKASWREAGQSGNAFVEHEQAVFKEIFDACSADQPPTTAALGGFVVLSPALRRDFHIGLPLLMNSQMNQVFTTVFEPEAQLYQDWANELYTCSDLDRKAGDLSATSEPATASYCGDAALHSARWDHKLYFGGTETASYGGGHMEGALASAQHLARELLSQAARVHSVTTLPSSHDARPLSATELNAASLRRFTEWVDTQRDATFARYRQHLNYGLATQQRDQLTQRAMLTTMEQLFAQALAQLADLPFATKDVAVEKGRSALTLEVQTAFDGCMQHLLDAVTEFNRTSCALSNFPDEHHLAKEYVQVILRDLAAAWREFSLAANQLLLDKSVTFSVVQAPQNMANQSGDYL